MSDAKIKSLKRKYLASGSEIKSIYEAGKEAISNINFPSKVNCFKGLFRNLNKYYDKCEDIYEEICELYEVEGKPTEFPDQDYVAYRTNIRKYYMEAITNHETVLALQKPSADETSASRNVTLSESVTSNQLPKMNLPSFNGELIQWPKFRDIFTSLIHDDATISPIRKFHYLITSLSGSPLSIVNKLPLTSDNYSIAWKALVEAYDNKRILASSYLNELVNFKPLQGRPSVQSLKLFLSKISENISAFKLFSIPNESEFILYHLAIRRLDPHTREQFEIENQKTEFPTFEKLSDFIRGRCLALQLSDNTPLSTGRSSSSPSEFNMKPINKHSPHKSSLFTNKGFTPKPKFGETEAILARGPKQLSKLPNCPVCGQSHKLLDCIKFTKATAQERFQWLKSWSGCRNCLSASHTTKNCSSKWHCRFCDSRHHSLLHLDMPTKPLNPKNDVQPSKESTNKDTSQALSIVASAGTQVLLGTAIAYIKDARGLVQPVRIVLDSGSQSSFITQRCLNQLGLHMSRCPPKISGIGCSMLEGAKGKVTCSLTSVCQNEIWLTTEAIVVKQITTDLPMVSLSEDTLFKLYSQFKLADPKFWESVPVDFLLGSDLFADVITGSPVTIKKDCPKLFPTVFGHVVIGRFLDSNSMLESSSLFCNTAPIDLMNELHRFWELEEPAVRKPINNPEDELCEKHFQETHHRDEEGRYVVSLPFKGERPSLGDSIPTAKKRFQNLENKLLKHPSLKTQYCDFMQEYIDLGHMAPTSSSSSYVIPHHSVSKEDRSKIKLRVVFDASSSTSKGSLNDHLMVGPKLQTYIKEILLGFRTHNLVFVCDVVKTYRNILVNDLDREYQHILWIFNPEDCIQKFDLNTLTYGMSCSPFLALRVLHQLKEDEGANYPQAAPVICRDMYVDDLVTGAPSIEEALTLQAQVVDLLKRGGFTLSKWASNHPDLLKAVSENSSSQPINMDDSESGIKILGLVWKPENDCFSNKVNPVSTIFSKRAILSTIARLYDPLGFISPVIAKAKIILQELWKANIDWDEDIPDEIKEAWTEFVLQLPCLSNLNIRRFVCQIGTFTFQIIGFCDASSKAYSAAIYLRTITSAEETTSMVLISKTKLAPVKTISIPRLELCGALLLSKLFVSLKDFLKSPKFFTDSSVVLGWLNTPAFKLKTFVANRVTEILERTPVSSWHHVRSEENPSDCCSRGLLPQQLLHFDLWWKGPSWLTKPLKEWPINDVIASNLPELKPDDRDKPKTLLVSQERETYIMTCMNRFSSFSKFINVMAWCLRWINNARASKTNRTSGPLTITETQHALSLNIKIVQEHYFNIGESENTKRAVLEKFKNLSPYFDGEGILRVGGRLSNSTLPVNQKHPILLPNKCHFTNILIDYYHKIYLRPGPNLLQALIQLKFWAPSLRRLVRSRVFLCILCYRSKANAQSSNQYMSSLPQCRFQTGRAFLHTGIDFAGPFLLKASSRRKAAIDKAYLCLFICMATKAVHLELVTSLSTDAFLASFSRFISRRGIPQQVYTDCGTNFVGAAKQLKQIFTWFNKSDTKSSIVQYATNHGINWNFNPPNAPHFGGLWEANIKSAKRIITKIAGNSPMTYEELNTLFTKTEAVLNSRPLHPLSSSPEENDYISPGHFLIGNQLLSVPSPTLIDCKENTLNRWQLVQKMSEQFWRRWTQEYLCTLRRRSKWLTPKRNLAVGDLVLLKDPNAPVLRWPLARIKEVHPGKDGLVRVVTIKTGSST